MSLKSKILIFSFVIFLNCFCFSVFAGQEHNVWGWAWSSNIGWIKFNNCTNPADPATCGTVNYGVHICTSDTDPLCASVTTPKRGKLVGYAWSSNIGWIRFDPPGPYPTSPNFSARVDLDGTICGQRGKICGWARACAGATDPTNCSGSTNPASGGWDGWIKLSGSTYAVSLDTDVSPVEFRGFAWGGDPNSLSEAVIGWISFNCRDRGVCSTSTYKVMTSFSLNQPPTARICCNTPTCPPETCTAYRGELFTLYNASTDPDNNIVFSEWDILGLGSGPELTCNGICNFTPDPPVGTWTVILKVRDSLGYESSATKTFTILRNISADFECSLNPNDPTSWRNCEGFRVMVDQTLYLRDTSSPSDGATIASRYWTFQDGQPATSTLPTPSVIFARPGRKIISLSITDTNNRTTTATSTINVISPPIYFPIPPVPPP